MRRGLWTGCSNYTTADLSKSIHRPYPAGQIDVSTAVEYQFSGYMRFNLNLINSRTSPPSSVKYILKIPNVLYILYIILYRWRSNFSYFFPHDFHCYRDTVFQFPSTPLLSTLYNLAPMMKCLSGKCELIPTYTYCKINFNIYILIFLGPWDIFEFVKK